MENEKYRPLFPERDMNMLPDEKELQIPEFVSSLPNLPERDPVDVKIENILHDYTYKFLLMLDTKRSDGFIPMLEEAIKQIKEVK